MGKTYYISDHHFFHSRIIEYCNRPFIDVEEMDSHMLYAWNAKVLSEDTVIFGGDLVLAGIRKYKKRVSDLLSTLNGRKILVKGNHDRSRNTMIELGFVEAHSYYFEGGILVIHNLMQNWDRLSFQISDADYVLYGHVHDLLLDDPRVAGQEKFINISVEHLNYIPRTIEELKVIRKKQLEEGVI